jgi:predicted dehydrogenase
MIGIIGCGHISSRYLTNLQRSEHARVVACADQLPERAAARAAEFGVPRACSIETLLADPEVGIVLNLTTPDAHASVAFAAIEAGKSVYNEKPLAIAREDGWRMLDLARERGVRVGCAPDTFLGGGLQTCRKLIDEGAIGEPVAATAFMLCPGHESWHPAPAFYYQTGGGPLFDMGPYYLTALISLIGPVRRVTGSARITVPTRTITSAPLAGTTIDVEVPTHVAGVLDFAHGAIGTLVTSFDVWASIVPPIEVHGTRGSLLVPDPDTFGGPVRIRRAGETEWTDVPLTHGHTDNARGLGVVDLVDALATGRPHRASGELAFHVLNIMHAIHEASEQGRHIELGSGVERPEPLPQSDSSVA